MDKVFPKTIDNQYRGHKIALIFFYLFTAMTVVRSLIHMFSKDGGAQSIATIPLDSFSAQASSVIVLIFALWGLSQLLMGVLYVIVLWRYKSLIPLMYLFIFLEYVLRIVLGTMKPIVTDSVPPGAVVNLVFPPLALILFALSIRKTAKKSDL